MCDHDFVNFISKNEIGIANRFHSCEVISSNMHLLKWGYEMNQLALNLNAMSAEALQALLADAQAALSAKAKIEKLRADVTALIEGEGFTVADVFPPVAAAPELPAALPVVRRGRKPKNAVDAGEGFVSVRAPKGEPKYQNPNNPEQKWTGAGRKPFWLSEALEKGATLTDFLIVK